MKESASEASAEPGPGLLILTGASHTGKTTVAEAILELLPPPVALLGVDRILEGTLVRPQTNRWRSIPLAYDLLRPQVEILLRNGWFVIFESTFTFVPEQGEPELHLDQLELLEAVAGLTAAPALAVQLMPPRRTPLRRAEESSRLPVETVIKTVDLHESASLPARTLRLDPAESSPEMLAKTILGHLGIG